jgi:hypothetical protein
MSAKNHREKGYLISPFPCNYSDYSMKPHVQTKACLKTLLRNPYFIKGSLVRRDKQEELELP